MIQEAGLVGVIVALGVILTIFGGIYAPPGAANSFFNSYNLLNGVATPMAIFAIMAVGATVVIVSGGIDISVGSIFALSAVAAAWAARVPQDAIDASAWRVLPIAIGVPLAVGLVCGLINGLLIVGLRIHPFIVTLGTLGVFRGLVNVLPPTKALPGMGWAIPSAFTSGFMSHDYGMGLRLTPMLIMAAVVILGWIFLGAMTPGRALYAIGGNEEAARFAGIRVNTIKLLAYALSGLSAGIAGMVSVGRFESATTNTGEGYELTVIAAAVVGGASLAGGRGSAIGALLGALVIRLIEDGIFIVRLDQEYSRIIIGAAIILAVAIDRLGEYARQRRMVGKG